MSNTAQDFKKMQDALKEMQKQYGKGSVQILKDAPIKDWERIPIDSLKLSRILGGGVIRGGIIEIFGWESSGKTTLASYLVGQAQKAGLNCAYIDSEHAFEPKYAQVVGVDTDNLIFSQPDSGEQALSICESLVDTIPNLGIIVIDSIASLTPQSEIDGDMGDAHMGLQARLLSQAMRKLAGKLRKNKVTLIGINQIRHKIGVVFGNPETTSGGNAMKFYSAIRLNLRKAGDISEAGNTSGLSIKIKAVKNKTAPPMREDILDLYFATGFDEYMELVDLGIHYEMITRSGAWYTLFNSEERLHGKNRVADYYRKNGKEAELLRKEILIALNGGEIENED